VIKRFTDYLTLIGMTEKAFVSRVEHGLARLNAVSPERIDDIVVEDLVQEDGTRRYLHISAFSKNYIHDVDSFLTQDGVTVYSLAAGVIRMRVDTTNYEFEKAKAESRIHVDFTLARHRAETSWTLQGTGSNCDHVWSIVKKYITPRLG
jgi:hypothetical protein